MSSKEDEVSVTIVAMENNEIEPVSSDSLPAAENQPPLVVDLPDGQKLVVGNLDPGTVVEVATWRGTGRPDSRTNRLMLGVSNNESGAKVEAVSQQIPLPQGVPAAPASVSTQVHTGVNYADLTPAVVVKEKKKSTAEEKKHVSRKRVLRTLGWVAAVVLIVGLLGGPLGLRVVHPQSGASTAIGSASSSLVFTRPLGHAKVGQNVIANLHSTKKNPVIAVISAVGDKQMLLAIDGGYAQVNRSDIAGKVTAVLPFLGYVAGLFN
jgi:hypothetical protein